MRREGFLADADNRAAIAMAIDRAALTAALRPDWESVATLLPAQFDSATAPVAPGWASLDLQTRRLAARARVTVWRAGNEDAPPIRVAMPDGPGARIVWAFIADALRGIGLDGERVAIDTRADLRLIDQVAPYDSGRWYLSMACQPCSAEAEAIGLRRGERDRARSLERDERRFGACCLLKADCEQTRSER